MKCSQPSWVHAKVLPQTKININESDDGDVGGGIRVEITHEQYGWNANRTAPNEKFAMWTKWEKIEKDSERMGNKMEWQKRGNNGREGMKRDMMKLLHTTHRTTHNFVIVYWPTTKCLIKLKRTTRIGYTEREPLSTQCRLTVRMSLYNQNRSKCKQNQAHNMHKHIHMYRKTYSWNTLDSHSFGFPTTAGICWFLDVHAMFIEPLSSLLRCCCCCCCF